MLLENGRFVWAGVINDIPFVGLKEKKVALLMKVLGLGIMADTGEYLTAKEFLEIAKAHPILSKVDNWDEVGISTQFPVEGEQLAFWALAWTVNKIAPFPLKTLEEQPKRNNRSGRSPVLFHSFSR